VNKCRGQEVTADSHTVAVFLWILGNECVRSHQGEMSIAPAGDGSPVSRMTCRRARVRPPPAESPDTTICAGFMGRCFASGGGLIK
jgi:hypothetical protein